MFLLELCKAFSRNEIPYCLVGGYALALHGIVRATMDVDFAISLKQDHLETAEQALRALGLESRIPVRAQDISQFHEEYRLKRNLIAWSFVDAKNPTRQVDLLLHPPLKQLKTETISLHGLKIPVATKKTLLEMKRSSNRPEDQLDIQKLEEALEKEKSKK